MRRKGIQICISFLLIVQSAFAQNLDEKSRTDLMLSDSTCVVLFESLESGQRSNIFYYLPVNMRVSLRENRPEISLILFDDNGRKGAIMHFLLTWGLSLKQEEEARDLLHLHVNDSAFIAGSVLVDASPESFKIEGDNRTAKTMNAAMSQSSMAPLTAGSRAAASFRFGGDDADYISEVAKDPEKASGGKIRFLFTYQTLVKEGFILKPIKHEWILETDLKDLFKSLK